MSSYKVLLILTLSFIAFSIETDVYVPSFPDMVKALGVSESRIQQILSVNFLGICISCLFSGPLSDSFGRKKVLSLGASLFVIASLICTFSNRFEVILLARWIQGLGAGTVLAVGCSCLFDLYEPTRSGQLVAILNSIVTVTMSMAPILGVWLNSRFGWRSSFLFILILATASWIGITFFLPETLPIERRQPFQLRGILSTYFDLITSRNFIVNILVSCLMFTPLIVYTANSSLLLIGHLNISENSFGFYQGITMGTFAIASLLCSYLIGKLGPKLVKQFGTALFFVGMLCLGLVCYFYPEEPLLISVSMAVLAVGISFGVVIYFTEALIGVTTAGAAISLAQGLRLFIASEMTELSRTTFNGSLWSLVMVLFGIAFAVLLFILLLPRTRIIPVEHAETVPITT